MGRILAALTTLLVLVLGAAFLLPAFIDWNDYRADIGKAASNIIGRPFTSKGKIEITLLPQPHIRLGEVTVAPPDGTAGGPLLTAAMADVTLSLQALLTGKLEADRVKLLHPAVAIDLSHGTAGSENPAASSALFAITAIDNLEIEDGLVALSEDGSGGPQSLVLDHVDGTLTSSSPADGYRFAGKLMRGGQPIALSFLARPLDRGRVKISGTFADPISKASLKAEGVVSAAGHLFYQGAVTADVPNALPSSKPIGIEAKADVKADLKGMTLDKLSLTLDPTRRQQLLSGDGRIDFDANTATLNLRAKSLDADALMGGEPLTGAVVAWDLLRDTVERVLWLHSETAVILSLAADQVQLRGEAIGKVEADGQRKGGHWVFDKVMAELPGEAALKLAGSLTEGAPSVFAGVVSISGKSLGSFARWIAPGAQDAKHLPPRSFAVNASMTLSAAGTALEGVTGNLGGTPFKASLHYSSAPADSLTLSLSGENLDFSGLGIELPNFSGTCGLPGAGASGTAKSLPSLTSLFGGLKSADLDLAAASFRTDALEARNLSARFRLDQNQLNVAKLNFETPEGLVISGGGAVPLKDGRGKFEGRLEARSADALRQVTNFCGFDAGRVTSGQWQDLVPAALSVSFDAGTAAGVETFTVTGTLGATRIDGKAELGAGAGGRFQTLDAQLKAAAPDGNRFVAELSRGADIPKDVLQGPATLAIKLAGPTRKLNASATLQSPSLTAEITGTGEIADGSFQFSGSGSASSVAPEIFAPAPILALLGGQPGTKLGVEAALTLRPGHFEAGNLTADSPGNHVTGNLAVDRSGASSRLDAELSADRMSFPALMNYFLEAPDANAQVLAASSGNAGDPPGIWAARPFSLPAFEGVSGTLALDAKAMALNDSLTLAGGHALIHLENGRIEVKNLEGKLFGGDVALSAVFAKKANTVAATLGLSVNNVDLAAIEKAPLVAAKASLSLTASGAALSPLGLIAVLNGKGHMTLSDGTLGEVSPRAVRNAAAAMVAAETAPKDDAIAKALRTALQSGDFKFRRLTFPITIDNGVAAARRAVIRSRDGDIRAEAYLDLQKMQADSTWEIDISGAEKGAQWPPLKLVVSGPAATLGSASRMLSSEDVARAISVKRIESNMDRLERLSKQPRPPSSWKTTQEPARQVTGRKAPGKLDGNGTGKTVDDATPIDLPNELPKTDFETRMHQILKSDEVAGSGAARP